MKPQAVKFELTDEMREGVEKMLRRKEEVFSLTSNPLLASLVTCLGLQYELGNPDQDRLSFALGVSLGNGNPWQSELISLGGEIGLRAWIPGGEELRPKHEDFRHVLHPLSLGADGRLTQLVVFPLRVAQVYASRGLELVVVRDWALSAFVSSRRFNYQKTNLQEIENNIASRQLRLMQKRQLAFTGTHDLADHLLGGHSHGLAAADSLLAEVDRAFARCFQSVPRRDSLVLSYLIAIVLDDLAQAQWYASRNHLRAGFLAVSLLELLRTGDDLPVLFLPDAFHSLVAKIRDLRATVAEVEAAFRVFSIELQSRRLTAVAHA